MARKLGCRPRWLSSFRHMPFLIVIGSHTILPSVFKGVGLAALTHSSARSIVTASCFARSPSGRTSRSPQSAFRGGKCVQRTERTRSYCPGRQRGTWVQVSRTYGLPGGSVAVCDQSRTGSRAADVRSGTRPTATAGAKADEEDFVERARCMHAELTQRSGINCHLVEPNASTRRGMSIPQSALQPDAAVRSASSGSSCPASKPSERIYQRKNGTLRT